MAIESKVLAEVIVNPEDEDYIQSFTLNSDGFLASPEIRIEDGRRLTTIAGFAVTGWQRGDESLENLAVSETRFDRLSESVKTLGHQGRGVGQRAYNTWEAFGGTAENYSRIGLYTVELDLFNLADKTGQSSTAVCMQRVALMLREQVQGLDATIAAVHRDLGPVDAAIYDQPPAGRKLQKERGVNSLPGVDEKLLIVRNSTAALVKRGEYNRY